MLPLFSKMVLVLILNNVMITLIISQTLANFELDFIHCVVVATTFQVQISIHIYYFVCIRVRMKEVRSGRCELKQLEDQHKELAFHKSYPTLNYSLRLQRVFYLDLTSNALFLKFKWIFIYQGDNEGGGRCDLKQRSSRIGRNVFEMYFTNPISS